MESFEIQALRDIVKAGGEEVIENLEEKFIEVRVEGKRKSPSSAMFTESLPMTHYTEKEHEEIEAMYMGKESLPRKRFPENSYNRGRERSFNQGQGYPYRLQSRDRYTYSRYGSISRSDCYSFGGRYSSA